MESNMLRGASAFSASSSQTFMGSRFPFRSSACGRVVRPRRHSSAFSTRAVATPLPLPNEYGYVVLTAAASAVFTQWQAFQVGKQRRKAGVPYPKMFEDAEPSVFNCYQRAHQNTLEAYPSFLTLLALAGLGYPLTASGFGILWIVGRLVYSLGYYTGDPKNRMRGIFHVFGWFGLVVTCVVLGVRQTGLLHLLNS